MKTKGRRKGKKRKWKEKTVKVNILPSRRKRAYMQRAQKKATEMANKIIVFKEKAKSGKEFHHLVYKRFKYVKLHSQVQEAVQRRVYAARKVKKFDNLPLEFNFPRSGGIKETERGNPVLAISPMKERIAIPIKLDGGWRRVEAYRREGWKEHSCKVFKRERKWVEHIILRKELNLFPPQQVEGTIGVDVGRKIAAAITLNHPSFTLIERYLGKDLAWKQHKFNERRRKLQSYADKGSEKARRALKRLKNKEKNYNKTRCEQIAHEIVDLAVVTRSAIVIEEISKIRKKWTKKNFRGRERIRRSLNRWSYRFFLSFLTSLAEEKHIPVLPVPPHYTSQRCSRCGHVSPSSRVTRDLFRCVSCGFEVHSDRNASRNLSLLFFGSLPLPLSSSFFSYFPVPRERKKFFFPVSVVEGLSTLSSGSMTGSPNLNSPS
ncbi:MAG: transposase [Candidatus Heimdallarchaeum aukensis]|uniref:Transposase n=1 Tax=Candidatus Heimdallarchaeum aukensis TaxID=2876573 RepID=A0A9Y1BI28_9ARCH|nr:MAG: transposase [Candidatus Heimdallarchaeum aukensis]